MKGMGAREGGGGGGGEAEEEWGGGGVEGGGKAVESFRAHSLKGSTSAQWMRGCLQI